MHLSYFFHLCSSCFYQKFALIIATIKKYNLKIKLVFNTMSDLALFCVHKYVSIEIILVIKD